MALVDDNAFPKVILAEGSAPASPSAGQFKLYVDSADHLLKYKNSSGTVVTLGAGIADQGTVSNYIDYTEVAAPSTPSSSNVRLYAKSDGLLYSKDDAGTETLVSGGSGGGGGSDVVQVAAGAGSIRIPALAASVDIPPTSPGTGSTEFDSSSLPPTGWTLFGTPTVDANTSAKSHLRIVSSSNSAGWEGYYLTSFPSLPVTITTRISDDRHTDNYQKVALLIGEASPGKYEGLQGGGSAANEYRISVESYTSPTSGGGGVVSPTGLAIRPIYLRVTVSTTTSVSYYWSAGGLYWHPMLTGRNPGFTIGRIGFGVKTEGTTNLAEGFIDWVRIS